jgi:hypothetical protein
MRRLFLLTYAQCLGRRAAWELLAGRYVRAERVLQDALGIVGRVGALRGADRD